MWHRYPEWNARGTYVPIVPKQPNSPTFGDVTTRCGGLHCRHWRLEGDQRASGHATAATIALALPKKTPYLFPIAIGNRRGPRDRSTR